MSRPVIATSNRSAAFRYASSDSAPLRNWFDEATFYDHPHAHKHKKRHSDEDYEHDTDSSGSSGSGKSKKRGSGSSGSDTQSSDDEKHARKRKPKKKSNTATIVLGIVIGVLLLALIGAGVWYFMKKKNADDPTDDTASPSSAALSIPQSSPAMSSSTAASSSSPSPSITSGSSLSTGSGGSETKTSRPEAGGGQPPSNSEGRPTGRPTGPPEGRPSNGGPGQGGGGPPGNSESKSEDAPKNTEEAGSTNTATSEQAQPTGSGGNESNQQGNGECKALETASCEDQKTTLDLHNAVRAKYHAEPLVWDDKLAEAQGRWAENCVFEHSGGAVGDMGENIWAGSGSDWKIKDAVAGWAEEDADYDFSTGKSKGKGAIGHFTQIVWLGTKRIGCGWKQCQSVGSTDYSPGLFYTCGYDPPGNFGGEYQKNVLPA